MHALSGEGASSTSAGGTHAYFPSRTKLDRSVVLPCTNTEKLPVHRE